MHNTTLDFGIAMGYVILGWCLSLYGFHIYIKGRKRP